jgi:hypothetical protein
MEKIKDLFDKSKDINREIDSVVTFGANTPEDMNKELTEYVVTDKLHENYVNVMERIGDAFKEGSKEVGVWVSGFYGSGKSSFAKYLGYSFDKAMILPNGQQFGEKLMNKIGGPEVKALNHVIQQFDPIIIMIDLLTAAQTGKRVPISNLMYYETLKKLGFRTTEPKLIFLQQVLEEEGKYDAFKQKINEEMHRDWEKDILVNPGVAVAYGSKYANEFLPSIFRHEDAFNNLNVDSVETEAQRFDRLMRLVKQHFNNDRVIFVLDEIGLYMSENKDLITSLEGTMHVLKDHFKGKVWVIGTAQQTLTANNPNSANEIYTLNARFPIKVDIEADDIKEIVTKRLLGKSEEGKKYLKEVFNQYGPQMNLSMRLADMDERSLYYRQPDCEQFVNLYPFMPVHITMLLELLKKLASRTGGVGLRSVIRLIRDILVENRFADQTIGRLVTPSDFYDVLRSDMESNPSYNEIVQAAKKAMVFYKDNDLAVRICKTVAVLQILEDFKLTLKNLCALLYSKIGDSVSLQAVKEILDDMKNRDGITLQEIDGRYRFLTNAILNVQSERSRMSAKPEEKKDVLVELVRDVLMDPALPTVLVYQTLTVSPSIELYEARKIYTVENRPGELKLNFRFIDAATFDKTKQTLLKESNLDENKYTLYLVCNLNKDKDSLLNDIVKDDKICQLHQNDTNKEIVAYLKGQKEDKDAKYKELRHLLRQGLDNSEAIYRGQAQMVDSSTYKSEALKQFAERVYEKYPLANRSMKGSSVMDISAYEDFSTVPPSLNPFGIIQKNGTIDTSNKTFAEIKDFIEISNNVSGVELLDHFDRAPYKWSKDTLRYLVALMLKGNMIVLHANGQTYKMLTEKAAEAMKSNPSFNHLNFEMNTDVQINPKDLVQASNRLTELFGIAKTPPLADQIAKTALKHIRKEGGLLAIARDLKKDFEDLSMSGKDTLDTAINYAQDIVDSEGQKAPQLLSSNNACVDAFSYVMKVYKANHQNLFLDDVKTLKKMFMASSSIPDLPLTHSFIEKREAIQQRYKEQLDKSDCYEIYNVYADLLSELKNMISSQCIAFYTDGSKELDSKKNDIRNLDEYQKLNEVQQHEIDYMLDKINLTQANNLDGYQVMVNNYTSFIINSLPKVIQRIKDFKEANAANSAHDPLSGDGKKAKKLSMNKHLSQKQDVESLIQRLQDILKSWDEYDGIDIDLN